MPYLRFFSPDLPVETKRLLARELTEGVVRALHLPADAVGQTTVYFMPFRAEDIANGGLLISDGGQADYHLEVIDRSITREKKAALNRELTPRLAHALQIGPDELCRINLIFRNCEPTDMSVGGRFFDEMGH
jgi:phenylpyruvate tautomerase PptA (4-oxalocrotonate tautomerase family)